MPVVRVSYYTDPADSEQRMKAQPLGGGELWSLA
jgi:hypothetical protein